MTGSMRRSVLVMMACLAWGHLAAATEPGKASRSRASTKSKTTAATSAWDKPTADYVQALGARARQAYVARLAGLTDEQLRQVLIDRFCMTVWWKRFDKGVEPSSPMVAAEWRRPAWEESCVAGFRRLRELLIPTVEQVADAPLLEQRQALLAACAQADALAASQPPVAQPPQKAPTGLEYPALNRGPATAVQKFQRLERAVLVANSIADADSVPVLLENEQLADGLDVEEASAIQYMNERRLIAGSTALRISLLSSAAVRDHVTDMCTGQHNVVNHSSDKGDFFQRMTRFGYEGATEGLGFGYNGPNFVDQQCYGGGHTIAVYSTGASEVGCGCHDAPGDDQAVYGLAYGGSPAQRTPWYEDGFFLPPGLDSRRLEGAAANAYAAVKNNQFQALKPLAKRREAQPGQADATSIAVRFLLAYVELQIDH
ncbi:MAG: CAP domain-containing protein, partial [Planctomycetaceae bacterium]